MFYASNFVFVSQVLNNSDTCILFYRQLNVPLGLDAGEQLRQTVEEDYPDEQEMYVCLTEEEARKFGAKRDDQGYVVSATRSSSPPIASLEVRKCMARIRNCIEILNAEQVPIHRETIRILYDTSRKYEPKELLQPTVAGEVFSAARQDLWGEQAGHAGAD